MYCQPEDSTNTLIFSTFDTFLDARDYYVGTHAVEFNDSVVMFG